MCKAYARQVNPEYQESPYCWDGDEWYKYECAGIIFDGNGNYLSHTTAAYDNIRKYMIDYNEAFDEIEYLRTNHDDSSYKNITEIINDFFPKEDGKSYGTQDIHKWKLLLNEYSENNDRRNEDSYICEALELITRNPYTCEQITGCVQGEWQDIYYPINEYDNDQIERIETDYFNTGTEWIIHDDEEEPESPEEISGASIYCYSWNNDGIRKEIADCSGCEPEDVVLYEFNGYSKTELYSVAI